jgi:peptidyl-dipeptidase Dcp
MDDIFLNAKLFNRVKAVYDARQSLNLKPEQMKLLDNTYKNFVRAGADLPEAEKEKLRNINQELSMLTVKFGDNLLAENKSYQLVIDNPADLEGMPQSVIDMAAQTAKERNLEGNGYLLLMCPALFPFSSTIKTGPCVNRSKQPMLTGLTMITNTTTKTLFHRL